MTSDNEKAHVLPRTSPHSPPSGFLPTPILSVRISPTLPTASSSSLTSSERVEWMIALYDLGLTYREIGRLINRCKNTVASTLSRHYPERRPRSKGYLSAINRRNSLLRRTK